MSTESKPLVDPRAPVLHGTWHPVHEALEVRLAETERVLALVACAYFTGYPPTSEEIADVNVWANSVARKEGDGGAPDSADVPDDSLGGRTAPDPVATEQEERDVVRPLSGTAQDGRPDDVGETAIARLKDLAGKAAWLLTEEHDVEWAERKEVADALQEAAEASAKKGHPIARMWLMRMMYLAIWLLERPPETVDRRRALAWGATSHPCRFRREWMRP